MSTMASFYKPNTISLLFVLAMLLFNLRDTSHAFVPASTSSQVYSSNIPAINGASSVTVAGGRTRVVVSFSPQVHSIMSVADVTAKIFAAGLPAKILIMKDASGASSSLLELTNYADPELQAELLLDFSHLFLDTTRIHQDIGNSTEIRPSDWSNLFHHDWFSS